MALGLARLVYRMLKYGQQYIDKGAEYYHQRNRQQQIEFLRKKGRPARLTSHTSPCVNLPIKKFLESRIPGHLLSGRSALDSRVHQARAHTIPMTSRNASEGRAFKNLG